MGRHVLVQVALVVALTEPAVAAGAGLQTLFDTGPADPVLFNGALSTIGFSSGNLCNPDCRQDPDPQQRRIAQAFTLPALPQGAPAWRIREIIVEGFDPGGTVNDELNFQVFERTGLMRPVPEDSLIVGGAPFPVPVDDWHTIEVDFGLPPGDYWLTVWASSTSGIESANFAWLANAPNGINVHCPGVDCVGGNECGPDSGCNQDDCPATDGDTMLWKACHWPPAPGGVGIGFGSAVLTLGIEVDPVNDPDPDPDDLLNAAFRIRGAPQQPCPWDCDGESTDGNIGITDFLALLAQWGGPGSCDFDGGGVGINDFLELLANWGPCP